MSDIKVAIELLTSINECHHLQSVKLAEDSESSAGEIHWCGRCGAIRLNHIWHRTQAHLWQYVKFRAGNAAPVNLIKEKEHIEARIYAKRTGSPLNLPTKE